MQDFNEVVHRWEKSDPTRKVKLIKNSKGYTWEISFEHTDNAVILAEIQSIDKSLRETYGTVEG